MLSRPSDNGHTPFGDIFLSESPDLIHWGRHRHVLGTRRWSWESTKIGAGPIPIETDEGWLVIYHGVLTSCNGFVYSMGAALLDLDEPWRVIARARDYLLSPQVPYEQVGDVPNVVFPCAALVDLPCRSPHRLLRRGGHGRVHGSRTRVRAAGFRAPRRARGVTARPVAARPAGAATRAGRARRRLRRARAGRGRRARTGRPSPRRRGSRRPGRRRRRSGTARPARRTTAASGSSAGSSRCAPLRRPGPSSARTFASWLRAASRRATSVAFTSGSVAGSAILAERRAIRSSSTVSCFVSSSTWPCRSSIWTCCETIVPSPVSRTTASCTFAVGTLSVIVETPFSDVAYETETT